LIPEKLKFFRPAAITRTRRKEAFQILLLCFSLRKKEADSFYADIQKPELKEELKIISAQSFCRSFCGNKQFLLFRHGASGIKEDPGYAATTRHHKRNSSWLHLTTFDVLSILTNGNILIFVRGI